jgi:tagaturonate reductase
LQRFKNPFIEHQWESILLNYSSKVKIRVLPLLTTYYQRKGNLPGHIAEGFASYLALSIPDEEENGQYFKWAGGRRMRLQDELSPLLYQDFHSVGFAATVKKHLHNSVFWGFSLETLPGFSEKALELAVKLNPGRQIV